MEQPAARCLIETQIVQYTDNRTKVFYLKVQGGSRKERRRRTEMCREREDTAGMQLIIFLIYGSLEYFLK